VAVNAIFQTENTAWKVAVENNVFIRSISLAKEAEVYTEDPITENNIGPNLLTLPYPNQHSKCYRTQYDQAKFFPSSPVNLAII